MVGKRDEALLRDVLVAIRTKTQVAKTNGTYQEHGEYYLRSPQSMYEAFPNHQDAVQRSQQIADSVDIDLLSGQTTVSMHQRTKSADLNCSKEDFVY